MVPVWLLVLLLCLQALSFVATAWIQSYFGNKSKSRSEAHVEMVLNQFLARKLEDINMSRLLSDQIRMPIDNEDVEADEIDANNGMTPEEIRRVVTETEAEVELARQSGERA